MLSKQLRFILFLLFLFFIYFVSNMYGEKEKNPFSLLSRQDKEQLIKLIFDARPFLESAVDVRYEHTLNRFFNNRIYRKLTGNPFVGYIYDEGISITDNRFKIDCVKSRSDLKEYGQVFERLFHEMVKAKKNYIVDDKAAASIGIFIADITPEPEDKHLIPSITIELYIKDNRSNRAFFKRFSTGNRKELYYAMRLSIKRIFLTLDYLKGRDV